MGCQQSNLSSIAPMHVPPPVTSQPGQSNFVHSNPNQFYQAQPSVLPDNPNQFYQAQTTGFPSNPNQFYQPQPTVLPSNPNQFYQAQPSLAPSNQNQFYQPQPTLAPSNQNQFYQAQPSLAPQNQFYQAQPTLAPSNQNQLYQAQPTLAPSNPNPNPNPFPNPQSNIVPLNPDPSPVIKPTVQPPKQKATILNTSSTQPFPKNLDQQIAQKKNILQNAEQKFLRSANDCQIISTKALKEQIFNKAADYTLTRNYFKQFQILLNSYLKIYEQSQSSGITQKVREFGKSVHRLLTQLHFDHQRACQIANILFQGKFITILDQKQYDQQNVEQVLLNLVARIFKCCERDLSSFGFLIMQMITQDQTYKQMSAGQIDDNLTLIIQFYQKNYPATQEQQQEIKQRPLKYDEMKDVKIMLKLKGKTGKQKWANLNQDIMKIGKQAEQQQGELIAVTKQCCLDNNGSSYKTGTKVKGQQSIDRVKEKLVSFLFQPKKDEKPYKEKFKEANRHLPFKQFLKKENEEYDKYVQNWIANQQEIQFSVDDMVRGKVMFESIDDIYKAAQKIIQNCKQRNIGVVKVKNRLNKKTSDLVFKLKMKNVVAQFQLAIKFNVVKNEFNHKIYQLLRSPGFSVTSTILQNKEKSQRFIWDIQSMTKDSNQLSSQIKSQLDNFIKRNHLGFKWDESTLKLKQLGKNNIKQGEINQLNRRYWTGIFLRENHQYQQALDQLNKALKLATETNKDQSGILVELGNIYQQGLGKLQQALQCFTRCLRIKETTKGKQSIECCETLKEVGDVLAEQGKYAQALQHYNRCLKIEEEVKGKQSFEYGQTLLSIGNVQTLKQNFQQALQYYTQSMAIIGKIKGQDSIENAQIGYSIGHVCIGLADYQLALKCFNEVLKIQQTTKGKDSIECAETLNKIGICYTHKKQYQPAVQCYTRFAKITEKIQGGNSVGFANAYFNVGYVLVLLQNNQAAIQAFNQCRKILKGKDSLQCSSTLDGMGRFYYEQGKHPEALECFNDNLQIQETIKGKNSLECAQTITNIGAVYQQMQNYQQAARYYERAVQIYNSIVGPIDERTVGALQRLQNLTNLQ